MTTRLRSRDGVSSRPDTDLLLNHPREALGERLQSGTYAGRRCLDGDRYHPLLLSFEALDVQLWVAVGDAPVAFPVRGSRNHPMAAIDEEIVWNALLVEVLVVRRES
jgi:hypothetical protein